MQRRWKIALIVPALILMAGIGAGSVVPDEAEVSGYETMAPAVEAVRLGAFTFAVDQPRHITYVVTRMSAVFDDEDTASYHALPENAVRLRDAVFDAVLDARPDPITGEVDAAAVKARVERLLSERLPELTSIEVDLIHSTQVPRR
jgi:hypothetical protein